jgi:hypothetical protein
MSWHQETFGEHNIAALSRGRRNQDHMVNHNRFAISVYTSNGSGKHGGLRSRDVIAICQHWVTSVNLIKVFGPMSADLVQSAQDQPRSAQKRHQKEKGEADCRSSLPQEKPSGFSDSHLELPLDTNIQTAKAADT